VKGGPVIQTRHLTKRYGSRVVAVYGLNLEIRRGEVYGLLGPNGAGKTTTLRMLLGLVKPTSGAASVLGAPPGAPEGLARIGAIVESPAFYPFLSGRDNLRTVARRACVPGARVEESLRAVRLAPRARDKFGNYSLGMKQRLGVAAALLKDPELLILDEPSNGLDPVGQAEMRGLIRALGGAGRTMILSSHNLSEVERLCDRVGVVSGGTLVAEGTVEELRGEASYLLVRAEPADAAAKLAAKLAGVESVELFNGALRLSAEGWRAAEIARKLIAAGLEVSELRPERRSFEEAFLELTGRQTAGAGSLRGRGNG
jgi:ABC-2 type transport system ATP-binding protein